MKKILLVIGLAISGSAFAGECNSAQHDAPCYGRGFWSCSYYLSDKAERGNGLSATVSERFIEGVLGGISVATGKDLGKDADLKNKIDSYCTTNPDQLLIYAINKAVNP